MNIFSKLSMALGFKQSEARMMLSFNQLGQPVSTNANFEGFTKQGYQNNVIVFRCIDMIAKAVGNAQWYVVAKDSEREVNSPLMQLINRPNPMMGKSAFFEAITAYLFITGNSLIEQVGPNENAPPMELWPVKPQGFKIIPGRDGYPDYYQLELNGKKKIWKVNPVNFRSQILHLKTFNPSDLWWGQSPLQAAMLSLDQNNSASRWNLALLQNSATPSGILKVLKSDSNPNGALTNQQYANLKKQFEEEYVGARNAARPLLLEGGMDWQSISMSPKDMDFLNNKSVTSADVALAYGVPAELLGLGQKTFNNYKEARLAFYEDVVIPTLEFIQTEFNNSIAPKFGNVELRYDKDAIDALNVKREAKFIALKDLNFLTVNEKREAVGYEPLENGDVILVGSYVANLYGGNDEPTDLNTTPSPEVKPEIEEEPDLSKSVDGIVEWKNFNLLNSNEKRTAWNRQNNARKQLEAAFNRDLKADLQEMYQDMVKAIGEKTDAKLIEYALLKAMDDNLPVIKKTSRRHIKYTVELFGKRVFQEAKSAFVGLEFKNERQYDQWAQHYIDTRTAKLIGEIEGTTKKQIIKTVRRVTENAIIDGQSNQEVASDLEDYFDGLSKSRARLIARTEVAMASTNANLNAVKTLQIPGMWKEWVTVNDDRVRDGGTTGADPDHTAMNGAEMPIDEKFGVPPDALMDGPGDESGGAGQVCNCRCVLVFKSKNKGEL